MLVRALVRALECSSVSAQELSQAQVRVLELGWAMVQVQTLVPALAWVL